MLYIFDSTEKLIATLPEGGFFDAVHREVLNGENTFQFTISANSEHSEYVVEGNLAAFRDLDSYWQVFEVKRIVDVHGDGLTRTAYCEHIFYELLDDVVTDKRPSADATAALAGMLEGTRWQVGIVDDLGASSTSAYYESALSAVQKVANAWKGELNWRCVIQGEAITRYVDLLAQRGTDTGKQFAYSKDILNIEREVDSSGVVTALYGRGKGIELDSGSYGRRLTFADVVAPDKPADQEWIGDNEALAQWGRPGGRHRFDVFIDEEETDPAVLLQKTRDELARRKVPRATYRLDVVSLEQLTGYEHEKVRLGDLVRVIDREFTPELVVSARVIEIERDILDPANTKVVLGSFAPTIVEATINTARRVNEMANRPFNTKWLDGKISVLQNAIENTQSYVFQTGEDGILVLDAPTYDQATKAMKLGGGMFAIANQKDGIGGWNWRTFGDGSGFTADLITAGIIDAGLVQIGPDTAFAPGYDPSQISSVGMGVDADCLGLWHFDGSLNSHKGVAVDVTNLYTNKVIDGSITSLTNWNNTGTLITNDGAIGNTCVEYGYDWNCYQNFANRLVNDKYYFVSAYGRVSSGESQPRISYTGMNPGNIYGIKDNTAWHRFGGKVICTDSTKIEFRLMGDYSGKSRLDGVMVVEITADEYNNLTVEQLMTRYPFAEGTSSPSFSAGCFGQALNGSLKAPTTDLSANQGSISLRAKNLSASANGSVLVDLPKPDNSQGIVAGIASDGRLYIKGTTATTVYGPNKSTLTAWDSISLAWKPDRLSLVVNDSEACYIENPGLPTVFGSHLFIGTDRNGANAINTLVDELRIDKVYREVNIRTGWHKTGVPFYTSEDMKQWPGYLRAETDGLKVYDSSDALRVLVGSWLKDAVRKYGIKIIDGEIYSTFIKTGTEGSKTYIAMEPPNKICTYKEINGVAVRQLELTDNYLRFWHNGDIAGWTTTANEPTGLEIALLGAAGTNLRLGGEKVFINGPSTFFGDLNMGSGTKHNIEQTENYGGVKLAVRESPEQRYVDEGMGMLIDGECRIDVDPIFMECIEPHTPDSRWYVNITPYGKAILYVDEIGDDYFIVKDYNDNANGIEFTWSLSATRKDYAMIRFMEVFD